MELVLLRKLMLRLFPKQFPLGGVISPRVTVDGGTETVEPLLRLDA